MDLENSLTKAYLNNSANKKSVSKFVEFLCGTLKYKSSEQTPIGHVMSTLFMRDYSITDSTFPNLSEIEQALDYNPESEALSKTINITNNKRLNQIL